jgi:NADH-quinone oxidoreductase subunit M
MVGSVLMLVAIIALYFLNGATTFDFPAILANLQSGNLVLNPTQQYWLFLAFFFAFAIKVPLFPLHTWLPDAHVEAPTAGSVILAGVLLKWALTESCVCLPMFPKPRVNSAAHLGPSRCGDVYGALVAMVQTDIKKLVAIRRSAILGLLFWESSR